MTADPKTPLTPDVKVVTHALYSQLMSVMGLKHPNWITRCLYPIFQLPAQRMSGLLVELDRNIAKIGWNNAVNLFLGYFTGKVRILGSVQMPKDGPLMVVCNHPAAYDLVILAAYTRRDDLKIIASDIPIIQLMPNIADHIIPVPYHIPTRLHTIRSSILHLKNEGSILIFPRGNVEPDPAISPGAEQSLSGWSASIELFLRQVPQTTTVVAAISGVLSGDWYKSPLINLWKKYEQRQKVAEIFQIASQLFIGKTPTSTPLISFSSPLSVDDLGGVDSPEGNLFASLIQQERNLLLQHTQVY
jgi:hypothetical protein